MRKTFIYSFAIGAAVLALNFAHAAQAEDAHSKRIPSSDHRGGRPSSRPEPRAHGIPQHGAEHHIMPTPGGPVVHVPVYHEPRGLGDVRRDPHIVHFEHAGWHPVGHWDHWYRDWGVFWRISDWRAIQAVTCEAVNHQTGVLFPVTESRADGWYWDVNTVNNVAARALDECVTEGGSPDTCSLVEGECWNSMY